MLLRFQKAAVLGNYETGNQAFSKRLRFLTTREQIAQFRLMIKSADAARQRSPSYAGQCCLVLLYFSYGTIQLILVNTHFEWQLT